MNRHDAREEAICLVFEKDFRREDDLQKLIETASEIRGFEQDDFMLSIVNGVFSNIDEIDKKINNHLKDWKLSRISKVSLAIMRVAIYEILFRDDIPDSVSINEAVEFSKQFENNEAAAFINGLLGSVVRGK